MRSGLLFPGAASARGQRDRGWPRGIGVLACCGAYALVLFMFPVGRQARYEILGEWRALMGEFEVLAVTFCIVFVTAQVWSARSRWYVSALVFSAAIGVALGCLLKLGWQGSRDAWLHDRIGAATLPVAYIGIAWLGVGLWVWQQREAVLMQKLHAERMHRSAIERQVAEAQMHALQAQLEPHFLFNTLAHLRRMYAKEPLAARKLLRDLRHYLGRLQPALNHTTVPLSEDAEYARAYLELQVARMGSRLGYRISLAPETLEFLVPPLALTTLAENAVKHGLTSMPEGGTITITSRLSNGLMEVEVIDDGAGLQPGHGSGAGLANLQARLQSTFGSRGTVSLSQRPQRGAVARIVVPGGPLAQDA